MRCKGSQRRRFTFGKREWATYVNLARQPAREITARGDMTAGSGDAYVPKDRVPYEIWNRLIGEAKK